MIKSAESMSLPPIVVIAGPTATGKSDLAVKLAKEIGGEVVNADSMQVYKGMNIGTAKLSEAEMMGVPHHLIDILDPKEDFNVSLFKDLAEEAISDIYKRGAVPIVCGGTGFYIQALLKGVDFKSGGGKDDTIRRELEEIAKAPGGRDKLYRKLYEVDKEAAESIGEYNTKRLIRGLEYFKITGEKISVHNKKEREKPYKYRLAGIYLSDDREELYNRINKRVDKMIDNGLFEEVAALIAKGVPLDSTAMQGIGYKEAVFYIKGFTDCKQAIEEIKKNTRHFAKRQITWFKSQPGFEKIAINEKGYNKEEILKEAAELVDKGIKVEQI